MIQETRPRHAWRSSCPHCGKTFNVDEAGYAEILSQVRNEAFEKDLHDRLELAEQEEDGN